MEILSKKQTTQFNSSHLSSALLCFFSDLLPRPRTKFYSVKKTRYRFVIYTILCTVIYMYYPFRFFISLMDQLNCMHVK